jgi:hypothetical protein
MKAMKREVAVIIYLPYGTGFPRSKCHVHETGDKSLYNYRSSAEGGNNVLRS